MITAYQQNLKVSNFTKTKIAVGVSDDETLASSYYGTAHLETTIAISNLEKIKGACNAEIDALMSSIDLTLGNFVLRAFADMIPSDEDISVNDARFMLYQEVRYEIPEKKLESQKVKAGIIQDPSLEIVEALEYFWSMNNKMEWSIIPEYIEIDPHYIIDMVMRWRKILRLMLGIELVDSWIIGVKESGKIIGMAEHSVRIHESGDLDEVYKMATNRYRSAQQ